MSAGTLGAAGSDRAHGAGRPDRRQVLGLAVAAAGWWLVYRANGPVWDRLLFHHAIWHLFVLAGSICHYLAIYWYVVPLTST